MADPLSITIGLITAFKEVYLLSQCIYKACESAKASEDERAQLRQDIRFELLYIQSFGRYYLQDKSVAGNERLDQYWMVIIRDIFEGLRKSFSDYSKLDDPKYLEFSPYVNESKYNTNMIEFNIDEPIGLATTMLKVATKPSKSSHFGWLSPKPKHEGSVSSKGSSSTLQSMFKSAKWALFDKKKLEAAVEDFRKERHKMRDILVMAQSAQFSKRQFPMQVLDATITSTDANELGLVPHARLIQLNEEDDDSLSTDYHIANREVKILSDASGLTAGFLEKKSENGETDPNPESVLIELKQYPPSPTNDDTPNEETRTNVQRLAGLLKISSSVLRTVPFQGYVDQPESHRYAFIYSYPPSTLHTQPTTLNALLASPDPYQRLSLSQRFDVAQKLAQSIAVFHADHWVHKSVSSHSVVFFKSHTTKTLLISTPYLVDFEYSRPEKGRTYTNYNRSSDAMAVYLHPDRPRMTFTKLHDIYALGIVLLEIATWMPAQLHYERAAEGLAENGEREIGKEEVRERFLSIATKSIPYHMGAAYCEAVVKCLDDSFRGQTGSATFSQVFQREIVDRLGAGNL